MDNTNFPKYIKARRYHKKGPNNWLLKDRDEYISSDRIIAFYPAADRSHWLIKWLRVGGNSNRYYLVIDPQYTLYFEAYHTLKNPHSVLHLA